MTKIKRNERLIWNFEFTSSKKVDFSTLTDNAKDELKWEQRYFWPHDQIIGLCNIDPKLSDLTLYHKKHKEDYYYLIPQADYNIKTRNQDLQYKPLVKRSNKSLGYGAKIHFDKTNENSSFQNPSTQKLINIHKLIKKNAILVLVKKEAFIYKFPTTPPIKLELARLEINENVYFSACIEGKSLKLVDKLGQVLLGKHISCEYVNFLKNILKL